jgi:hypothetical protein
MKWSPQYNDAPGCHHPPFCLFEKTTKITTALKMKTRNAVATYTSFQEWMQNTLVDTDMSTR